MTKTQLPFFSVWLATSALWLGCGDVNETPKDRPVRSDQFLVQSFTLKGTTATPAEVRIDGQSDADGLVDTSWQAELKLDGAQSPGSLPKDDGYTQTHTANVQIKTADGKTSTKKITITFHE